jgi:ATP-dependent DNA helicase RecG
MKSAEKDAVMSRFASGETKVLVSTTVIEVGVNVPNACLMIVENAERFGLSQLHQLRGRVGRGKRKSYCVLVSDINSQKSKERLEVMRTTYDGFEIAEKDLVIRGPGDFFSSFSNDNLRQSGGFEFRFSSMQDSTELLSTAFSVAKSIIESDPDLDLEIHAELKKEINRRIQISSSTIS